MADPRDFALVVGGGGGPMHGAPLGRELGVKEIIVPLYPGLFSAWGMLATEPRRDFMQTVLRRDEEVTAGDVRGVFAGPPSGGGALLPHRRPHGGGGDRLRGPHRPALPRPGAFGHGARGHRRRAGGRHPSPPSTRRTRRPTPSASTTRRWSSSPTGSPRPPRCRGRR